MIFLYPKALLLLFVLSKGSGAQLLSHLGPTSLASQMTIIGLYEIRVPSSYTDLPSIPATSLRAPPTCYPDGSIRSFTSLDDGVSFCQSWARDHGYAVRKCRNKSRGKEKVIYKVYIECECAGKKQGTKIPEQYR